MRVICYEVCVCASGIKVGGLPALSGMNYGWNSTMRWGEMSRFSLCRQTSTRKDLQLQIFQWPDIFFFPPKVKALLLMQEQHKLKLEVQAHILDRNEGLWATLSSCTRPSSHSYIVNEQKRERKNEKQHRSGFWRAGWDDIIPIPKPQRALCHWLDGNTNKVLLCPLRSRYTRRTLFETN